MPDIQDEQWKEIGHCDIGSKSTHNMATILTLYCNGDKCDTDGDGFADNFSAKTSILYDADGDGFADNYTSYLDRSSYPNNRLRTDKISMDI